MKDAIEKVKAAVSELEQKWAEMEETRKAKEPVAGEQQAPTEPVVIPAEPVVPVEPVPVVEAQPTAPTA